MYKSYQAISIYLFIALIITSCTNTKKATYFNELTNGELQYKVEDLEPVIQKNDILNITITSLNGEANQIFNLYSVSTSVGSVNAGTITQTSGYLVDQQGNIQLPMLGTIKAAGLNKNQLKATLTKSLVEKNILYDPIINIRYLNYKVTVLGEVDKPSVINVPSERITLLEALGLAGDLTMFAKRENVLIIREEAEGKRVTHHINLNSNELLTSPYYYLQSNDVVYVAPTKANVANSSTTRVWLPSLLAGLSFIAIILDDVLN
jgi:polysaccharide export outer membrane protein